MKRREILAKIETREEVHAEYSEALVRTAIRVTPEEPASVDVVAADGSLLCRLNIFDFGDGAGNVDVIIDPDKQSASQLRWTAEGAAVLTRLEPGKSVSATDIRRRA